MQKLDIMLVLYGMLFLYFLKGEVMIYIENMLRWYYYIVKLYEFCA